VLAAWREHHGLTALTEAAFAPFVDRVWADVHATPTDRAHASRNAERLAGGARRLGWSGSAAPRNVIGCANLGLCNFGCPSGAKQSMLLTYVPRALRAGARLEAGTRATRTSSRRACARRGGRAIRSVTRGGRRVRRGTDRMRGGWSARTRRCCNAAVAAAGAGVQVHSSVHVTARFPEPVHGYYGPTMAYAVDETPT
jgi:hypothetical protein